MRQFFVRRVITASLMILLTTVFTFALSRAAGDPRDLYLTMYTTPDVYEQWGELLGLNKPLYMQYLDWLQDAARLDFGDSLAQKRPVTELIVNRAPASLRLAAAGFAFAVVVGLPLGVLSAVKRSSGGDYLGRIFALIGQSTPPFALGVVLIYIFAVELGWLPTSRQDHGIRSYILPSMTLGWAPAAGLLRLIRSSMLEVLDSEFVKMARAKGASNATVIWKHALRNALIAPLTYSTLLLAAFVTGSILVESVFSWPGLGILAWQAVGHNDFALITGIVIMTGTAFILANLIADLLYAYLDPRIRLS